LWDSCKWPYNLEHAQEQGIIFEAQIIHQQCASLASLADMYPAMTIVVEHLACPQTLNDDTVFNLWRQNMSQLVERNNIIVKISGLMHPFFVEKPTAENVIRLQVQNPFAHHCMNLSLSIKSFVLSYIYFIVQIHSSNAGFVWSE
jgi:predicted TIM-barrel fold metal-dependent hydrolase